MSSGKWAMGVSDIIILIFTIYLFFAYFTIFFQRRQGKIRLFSGIVVLVIWLLDIPELITPLPLTYNICATIGWTLLAVAILFEGEFWKKAFFSITFDAIWMLAETLTGHLLVIYCEPLAYLQLLGSLASKMIFFVVIVALKKVFTNEEVKSLPTTHSILLVFIPIGSIYIMNAVFMLAYNTTWKYSEVYSLICIVILLFLNILIFYIYIKLADDLQVRRMNLVYEQQLDLCERHQKETEISMLQIREVRHNMRNHLISILAYANKGECEKIIKFVNDVMMEGNLKTYYTNSGNIVTDSLIDYWHKAAENEGIEFYSELCIPMVIPFKGAHISLILGNLLENAVEGARKAEGKKYIRLKMKYDRNNLLIMVENNYKGKLIKTKGEELKSTKADVANHGIGLSSVKRTARRYHGTVFVDDTMTERFLIRVVLYEV